MQVQRFMNKRRSESLNKRKVYLGHPFATLPSTNMLKINQHITTLSKALLTAGLLGGAAVATLGAGSAQAAWSPNTDGIITSCVFAPGGCSINDPSPVIVDKKLTLLDVSNVGPLTGGDTFTFMYQQTDMNYPWHVDLDFNPAASFDGSIVYKIDIVGCPANSSLCGLPYQGPYFKGVELVSARDGATTVQKIYGTGWDGTNITGVIDTLNLTNNVMDSGPAYGTTLYVKDIWTAAPGVTVDNINNNFSQVPAPLPLLGVGAALGSIRKLRKFSSQLKTFSMN